MSDIDKAKQILGREGATLAIVKEGQVLFMSDSSGIRGLLQAIEKIGKEMAGSSAADKVVGRAAALLLAYSKVKEVYASVISKGGLKVLKEDGIKVVFQNMVQIILDRMGKSVCPFEKFSSQIGLSDKTYEQLKEFAEDFWKKQ